ELFDSLAERSRALLGRGRPAWKALIGTDGDLAALGELLLSRRGQASGTVMAEALLAAYAAATPDERLAFLAALADRFGPDRERVAHAVEAFRKDGGEAINALHLATEPRRQELLRRLN